MMSITIPQAPRETLVDMTQTAYLVLVLKACQLWDMQDLLDMSTGNEKVMCGSDCSHDFILAEEERGECLETN